MLINNDRQLQAARSRSAPDQPLRHGLGQPRLVTDPGFRLYQFTKRNGGGALCYRPPGSDDFCAVSGTLIYRGRSAGAAARALYEDFDSDDLPYAHARGSYAVLLRRAGQLFLWIDQLGTYKVYVDAAAGLWSSSLLSLLDYSACRRLDIQAVYEYAFQGATYGGASVIEGIRLVEPNRLYRPLESDDDTVPGSDWWPAQPDYRSFDQALDANLDVCRQCSRELIESHAAAGLDSAISGGYDSRLLLAMLLEQGIRPRLHVYGRDSDVDVRIAKEISARLDIPVRHVDKSSLRPASGDTTEDTIERNFQVFDGLPGDGIFDRGADLATREQRCLNGELMLNGGGGEIYRNFFYLPDRRFSVRQLVWTFYSKFSTRFCTDRFDPAIYTQSLVEKHAGTLAAGELLDRRDLERAYPAIRLRFWMGRNNSVNNRLGSACTPLSEPLLIAAALRLPLSWKYCGRFEARLIQAMVPRLAACPSAYGHDFSTPPSLGHRWQEWLTRCRPPVLRRFSYRLQTRWRPPLPRDCLAGIDIDHWLPSTASMRQLFLPATINDRGVLARVASLEYLCGRYGLRPD